MSGGVIYPATPTAFSVAAVKAFQVEVIVNTPLFALTEVPPPPIICIPPDLAPFYMMLRKVPLLDVSYVALVVAEDVS